MINNEIKNVNNGREGSIIAKMNSLSDVEIVEALYSAAKAGVELKLIVRGIFCMFSQTDKFLRPVQAISIVDQYLEHARVWIFHNGGKEKFFISSADWMIRNLDHRVEATCPILDEGIKKELKEILQIQLNDNIKARWLNNDLSNEYVVSDSQISVRSQEETYHYLYNKTLTAVEVSSD
jgi:polyphosphate kinase